MTIIEYLNQEEPERRPRVDLAIEDVRIISKLHKKGAEPMYEVEIIGLTGVRNRYISFGLSGNLAVADEDGNPTKSSVFNL